MNIDKVEAKESNTKMLEKKAILLTNPTINKADRIEICDILYVYVFTLLFPTSINKP